jgi:single-strand DNA-binding protein
MLDSRSGGGGGSADSDSDFGSQGAMPARKPAMAGAGKRGDMDDEIPF